MRGNVKACEFVGLEIKSAKELSAIHYMDTLEF